ncbi:MAG: universal stress protein [Candidatus Acidiferrales bacterium]
MKTLERQARIELKNIVFATDFSRPSEDALPYAAELARHFGAKLYALHVRPSEIYTMAAPESWQALAEAQQAAAREKVRNLVSRFPDVKSEVVIEEGEIWPALVSTLEKNQIDLIVIGTRGRTGIGKLLLGSAAEEIFREAPCAVLTVGPHSPADPPAGGNFHEILFATDFSEESLAAVPYAISLAQEYQGHLTLLHVIAQPESGDLVNRKEVEASALRRMHALVPLEAEMWCEPWFMVMEGETAETILDVADDRKADLIVLGVRPPEGVPGAATHLPIATAHKLVSHAKCPVLTVRG